MRSDCAIDRNAAIYLGWPDDIYVETLDPIAGCDRDVHAVSRLKVKHLRVRLRIEQRLGSEQDGLGFSGIGVGVVLIIAAGRRLGGGCRRRGRAIAAA